jgi:quinol monooxygenase YgiN
MAKLLVHHKVQDYSAWRKVFDDDEKTRREYGSTGFQVLQSASDPNDLTVIVDWPSVDAAKGFCHIGLSQRGNEERGRHLPARGDVSR